MALVQRYVEGVHSLVECLTFFAEPGKLITRAYSHFMRLCGFVFHPLIFGKLKPVQIVQLLAMEYLAQAVYDSPSLLLSTIKHVDQVAIFGAVSPTI